MKSKFLKGVLGELLADRFMPNVDLGALKNIDNQNIEAITKGDDLQYQKKGMLGETTPMQTESAGEIDFQLFSEDVDQERFVNKTMNDEIIKSIKLGNYNDARKYMESVQDKYKEFGAYDSEPSAIIDSILENYFFGGQ